MVLQLVPMIKKPIEKNHHLLFDYSRLNEILAVVRQSGCTVISQELQLFCTMEIGVPVNRQEEVIYKLEAIPTVQVN